MLLPWEIPPSSETTHQSSITNSSFPLDSPSSSTHHHTTIDVASLSLFENKRMAAIARLAERQRQRDEQHHFNRSQEFSSSNPLFSSQTDTVIDT